jgi:hypothetical protein
MSKLVVRENPPKAKRWQDVDVLSGDVLQQLRAAAGGSEVLFRERGASSSGEKLLPRELADAVRMQLAQIPDNREQKTGHRSWLVYVQSMRPDTTQQMLAVLAPYHPATALALVAGVDRATVYRACAAGVMPGQLQEAPDESPRTLCQGLHAVRVARVPDKDWPASFPLAIVHTLERAEMPTHSNVQAYLYTLAGVLDLRPKNLRDHALEVASATRAVAKYREENPQP